MGSRLHQKRRGKARPPGHGGGGHGEEKRHFFWLSLPEKRKRGAGGGMRVVCRPGRSCRRGMQLGGPKEAAKQVMET